MRNQLRASERPRRLFEDVNATARSAGLLRGRRRVLDSTPLLDAVATQETVTQLRAAIRRLLSVADQQDPVLAAAVRAVLARDDGYATVGEPPCDWDDQAAPEARVDALVPDATATLLVLHGPELAGGLTEAAELLALVDPPTRPIRPRRRAPTRQPHRPPICDGGAMVTLTVGRDSKTQLKSARS